jgi:hypothetical protein
MMNDEEFEALEREHELIQQVEGHTCVMCHTAMFFSRDKTTTKPGQVYSEAGVREVRITSMCEHCFDEITAEPDEEDSADLPVWFNSMPED